MGIEAARVWLAEHAPELAIREFATSTATSVDAGAALGVGVARIAKTLALRGPAGPFLVLARGDVRLDSRKLKRLAGGKTSMLPADSTLEVTGHPIGGVCPFGLPAKLPILLDEGLRRFESVFPAGGSPASAVEVSPARLAEITGGSWADVARDAVR